MLFSYNLLKEYLQGKIPAPQKLEELLTMHVFEVEDKEKKKGDWIFDIDILPHRADCMSHEGLAREIAAAGSKTLVLPQRAALKAQKGSIAPLKVQISTPGVSRYSALVLEGLKPARSPQWLKDKLELLGVNSINTIVDITNYVMQEMGQPLHAFDYDKIKNHTMKIRGAREGEPFLTLDELSFKLPKGTLVIEDEKRLIDLAGIKGGKLSGIEDNTKNVVLQAATFSAPRIYKTKKELGYSTPAADLYAHNLDAGLTLPALQRAAALLKELSGGNIVQVIDLYPRKRSLKTIVLRLSLVQELLGISISASEAENILKRLGFWCQRKGSSMKVLVPTFRQDVSIPQDLVEEIGRIHGYEKIRPAFPLAPLAPPEKNQETALRERIQDSLKEAGFTETYNSSFIGERDLSLLGYSAKEKTKLVTLENPYSEELKYLRRSLLDNLLKAAAENIPHVSGRSIKIFEAGRTFENQGKAKKEHRMAAALLCFPSEKGEAAFFRAKGAVDFLLSRLGISGVWYDSFEQASEQGRASVWHPKKAAEIKVGARKIGFVGEIAPGIVSSLKLPLHTAAFQINLGQVSALETEELMYEPIPRFPAVLRDLAVLVPRFTKTAELLNIMHAAAGQLLWDVDLFDMYEGAGIPEEKKNLAFHLVYQSRDRTLTADEVDKLHQKIIKALEENPEWEARK